MIQGNPLQRVQYTILPIQHDGKNILYNSNYKFILDNLKVGRTQHQFSIFHLNSRFLPLSLIARTLSVMGHPLHKYSELDIAQLLVRGCCNLAPTIFTYGKKGCLKWHTDDEFLFEWFSPVSIQYNLHVEFILRFSTKVNIFFRFMMFVY